MTEQGDGEARAIFHSTTKKGKGVIRRCAGSEDLYQIRCVYVDPEWSDPMTLGFIRGYYCYEGARCVVEAVLRSPQG